jgi:hypothetical protein
MRAGQAGKHHPGERGKSKIKTNSPPSGPEAREKRRHPPNHSPLEFTLCPLGQAGLTGGADDDDGQRVGIGRDNNEPLDSCQQAFLQPQLSSCSF